MAHRVQVLDPDPACPARFVVDACVSADFSDARAAGFARGADVVTLEIERIAPDALLRMPRRRSPLASGGVGAHP